MRMRLFNRHILIRLLCCFLFLSALWPTCVWADDTDLSFYTRTSELSKAFTNALAPGSDSTFDESLNGVIAGNAGGVLGYADENSDDTGLTGWLFSNYTAASATITYEQLLSMNSSEVNPYYQYAGYGEALEAMGLSKTIRANTIAPFFRGIATGITIFFYLLANAAPFVFRIAVMFLSLMNPFKLFTSLLGVAEGADLGLMSTAAGFVTDFYVAIQNFSLVVILPALLILTIFNILVLAKGQVLKRVGRYALIVFMVFGGLPLIGATYTGVIDDIASSLGTGSTYADYLLMSSYVDFQGWVQTTRLAPTDTSEFPIYSPQTIGSSFADKTSTPSREMILNINGSYAGNGTAKDLESLYEDDSLSSVIESTSGLTIDESTAMDQSTFHQVFNLLTRHMRTATYSGSQFEGEMNGMIQALTTSDNEEDMTEMLTMSYADWSKAESGEWSSSLFNSSNSANVYNTGSLQTMSTVSGNYGAYESSVEGTGSTTTLSPFEIGGLSPVAMYNFLNTTFSSTGMVIYSSEKISSDVSRDSYAAVSFAGSGIVAFGRWVENILVMSCLAFLALAFSYGMIGAALRNLPRMLSGIFGTALGSIMFVTKLLVTTTVVIGQVLGTIFLYLLGERIILDLLIGLDTVTSGFISFFGTGGALFEFGKSLIVCFLVFLITKFLVTSLKTFNNLLEEVISGAIVRIMGALDTSTGGNGVDLNRATNGRIGGNGHLTEDAAEKDAGFLKGKYDQVGDNLVDGFSALPGAALAGVGTVAAAGCSKIGGVADILKDANAMESDEEEILRENGEAFDDDSFSKLDRRLGTAAHMASLQKMDDKLVANGESAHHLDDFVGSESDRLAALKDGQSFDPLKQRFDMVDGKRTDKFGRTILDENGNALDAEGNVISSSARGSFSGFTGVTTDSSGAVLDQNGEKYRDENGVAFYQDTDGKLINQDGQHMVLDRDGTLQSIDPNDKKSKPMSARKAVLVLDEMRGNAEQFDDMKNRQKSFSHGLDATGQAVAQNGKPLMYRDAAGQMKNVQLDDQGFAVDDHGVCLDPKNIQGKFDQRGFDVVKNAGTGQMQLRHKGDAAMKMSTVDHHASENASTKSLTQLSQEANFASKQSEIADAAVANLVAQGGSAYAIKQATVAQQKAKQVMNDSQQRFAQELSTGASSLRSQQVSDAMQVKTTNAYVQNKVQDFENATRALNNMKRQGANISELKNQQKVIQDQTDRVDQAKAELQTARSKNDEVLVQSCQNKLQKEQTSLSNEKELLSSMQQLKASPDALKKQTHAVKACERNMNEASILQRDVTLSHQTGRTFKEIRQAQSAFDAQSIKYEKAQQSYDDGVANGIPAKEIARRKRTLDQVTVSFLESREQLDQVSQPSAANMSKRDYLQAVKVQIQGKQQASENQLNTLLNQSSPDRQAIVKAQRQVQHYEQQYQRASQAYDRASAPKGWSAEHSIKTFKPVAVDQAASLNVMQTKGIDDYQNYKIFIQSEQTAMYNKQQRLNQMKSKLSKISQTTNDPTTRKTLELQIKSLTQSYRESQSNLSDLQNHSQGFLKKSNYQPSFMTKPLTVNGGMVTNRLVQMGNTQAIYNRLAYQAKAGTLSAGGQQQLKTITSRLSYMRKELIGYGIHPDSLKDLSAINQSSRQMGQAWTAYQNGEV